MLGPMKSPSPDKQAEEYFVIRVERRLNAEQSRLAKRDIFLGEDDKLVPIGQARHFADADVAADHIDQLDDDSHRYDYIIQFCSQIKASDSPTEIENLINQIMEIPYPYRRTAYNWLRGRDVMALLRRESEEVCERHRKVLLDHDIDITQKSDIILMKPKRGKLHINTGDDRGAAPRQYFAYPNQKPVPIASEDDNEGK